MRPETYKALALRQRTYWWHRARRIMALSLLRSFGLQSGCRWLDVGCGPGGNFHMLDALRPALVAGVDVSPIALELARSEAPDAVLVSADINEPLPFADASFDVVTIFNVMYHGWVKSEAAVLSEVARILRPGGLLLFTEPAFEALSREMDEAVMTRRRYRIADFDPWLQAAGFETLFSSYFTSFGVPILLIAKLLKLGKGKKTEAKTGIDMRAVPAPVNEALLGAGKIEAWALNHGVRMPFGTTLVCVVRRTHHGE